MHTTRGQQQPHDWARTRRLAQAAQDAGLPYPDLHVTGCRADGYTVRERGQVVAQGFRNSVAAQRAASAIRDQRWTAALAVLSVAV